MGIDWEEILDAEGEDLESAYTDSLPDSEPYPNGYGEPMRFFIAVSGTAVSETAVSLLQK